MRKGYKLSKVKGVAKILATPKKGKTMKNAVGV